MTQKVAAERMGRSREWWVRLEQGRVDPTLSELLMVADTLEAPLLSILGNLCDMNRRDFLAGLGALGVSSALDFDRLLADTSYVEGLEAMANNLAAQVYVVPPAALLPAAEGLFTFVRARMPGPARFAVVAAVVASMTGHLYSKTGRRGDAFAAYSLVAAAAEDADDAAMRSLALLNKSALYSTVARGPQAGDTPKALALLDAAAQLAGSTAPSRLRVGIHARRAEERAVAGDELGARRDLEAATAALAGPNEDERTFYSARSAAELHAIRGNVELLLGDHAAAVQTLGATFAEMNPRLRSWRAAVLSDQGAAYARLGELDPAVACLERAWQLAGLAGDHQDRVRGVLRRDLGQWAAERPVRRLDDQLRAG